MDRILGILKFLGIGWGVLSFVIAIAFFLGGEANVWKSVKGKVLGQDGEALAQSIRVAVREEFERRSLAPPLPVGFSISQEYSLPAEVGRNQSTSLGRQKVCFLSAVYDRNTPGEVAICNVTESQPGEWTLTAQGAHCEALCIHPPPS